MYTFLHVISIVTSILYIRNTPVQLIPAFSRLQMPFPLFLPFRRFVGREMVYGRANSFSRGYKLQKLTSLMAIINNYLVSLQAVAAEADINHNASANPLRQVNLTPLFTISPFSFLSHFHCIVFLE